jgi:hypothetical protein
MAKTITNKQTFYLLKREGNIKTFIKLKYFVLFIYAFLGVKMLCGETMG